MSLSVQERVARGQSTNAQDVDNRIQTQLKSISEIAVALKGLERAARSGGDDGKLTYAIVVSTSRANGVPRTVCFESSNLLKWSVQEAPKLLEQAECGKWSLHAATDIEEDVRTSKEMFPSYVEALKVLNVRKLRKLLTLLGYDKMRDDIKKGRLPQHMERMLSDAGYYYLGPYKRIQRERSRDSEGIHRGTTGRFESDSGHVTEEEGRHLTNFDAWQRQTEGQTEEQTEEQRRTEDGGVMDPEEGMWLQYFTAKGQASFKVSHGSVRECMVALRLLLEFKQPGSCPQLTLDHHVHDLSFVEFYLGFMPVSSCAICVNVPLHPLCIHCAFHRALCLPLCPGELVCGHLVLGCVLNFSQHVLFSQVMQVPLRLVRHCARCGKAQWLTQLFRRSSLTIHVGNLSCKKVYFHNSKGWPSDALFFRSKL